LSSSQRLLPWRNTMTRAKKSREELSAIIMDQLKNFPESHATTGVVIAPILLTASNRRNWHAAFTTKGRHMVPHIAWRIGNATADEFDLA
jgi:hypothetical protein